MSGNRKVIAYKVTPVFAPEPGSIGTACMATCMATGEHLSGSGGGGDFLKKEIVDALNMSKTGGAPRIIVDAALMERLVEAGDQLLNIASSDELSSEDRRSLSALLDSVRA